MTLYQRREWWKRLLGRCAVLRQMIASSPQNRHLSKKSLWRGNTSFWLWHRPTFVSNTLHLCLSVSCVEEMFQWHAVKIKPGSSIYLTVLTGKTTAKAIRSNNQCWHFPCERPLVVLQIVAVPCKTPRLKSQDVFSTAQSFRCEVVAHTQSVLTPQICIQ